MAAPFPEPVEGPGRLANRTVLVTGGARGQGAAHAERLATEGASVYIADVLDEVGDKCAATLRSKGLDVSYLHLDVADPGNWVAVRQQIEKGGAGLDGLVNNAGIIHVTPLEHETLEAWTRLLNVNLTGTFLGIQSMLPLLRKARQVRKGGQVRKVGQASIVNVSSIFGLSGAIGYAAYTASKSAILGLTRTSALELAPDGKIGRAHV